MVCKETRHDFAQPTSPVGHRLMHAPSQFVFHPLDLKAGQCLYVGQFSMQRFP